MVEFTRPRTGEAKALPTVTELEQRLTALEHEVADLRRRLPPAVAPLDWLARFDGAFAHEPAFAEVVKYGREFREADHPAGAGGP
jgi:hypothetical protein